MPDSVLSQRIEAIRRLARRGAVPALAKVVGKSRAEDLAAVMGTLGPHEQRLVFSQVRDEAVAADVLARLEGDEFRAVTSELTVDRVAMLVGLLDPDDQADIIEYLPEDRQAAILQRIHAEERQQVEELLGYEPDSAGGIMSTVALRLTDRSTCRDAIAAVQAASDHELIYYAYVESDDGQLVGVTSLRNLLTHPPGTTLAEIMATDVISVSPEDDQEDVARIASRYDLLAVPVVDDQRRLLGIVTVDDVVDVIRQEAAEDMLLMAGMPEEAAEPGGTGRVQAVFRRMPWLMLTMLGGFVVAEIVSRFSGVLDRELVLAGFIPIVTGMEGNVGIQSATVTVRNIALGRLEAGVSRTIAGEAGTGLALGSVFGPLIGAYCYLRTMDVAVSGAVTIAIVGGMTAATTAGALVPVTLRRLGVDPAIATGPFVTTAMDAVGLAIYLSIASLLLPGPA